MWQDKVIVAILAMVSRMDDKVLVALIGLVGVFVGALTTRYGAREKRNQKVEDRRFDEARDRDETVWQYAAPLYRSVESLRYRLKEIVEDGPAVYLLPQCPPTVYFEYKKVSTLYRIASTLGWIRGYRKERSYLDPSRYSASRDFEAAIGEIEKALADGQHVEARRLLEIATLWKVPAEKLRAPETNSRLAAELDVLPDDFLASSGKLSVSDLSDEDQLSLCRKCCALLSDRLKVDIPDTLVKANVKMVAAYLDIKEAYIYRDWQVAIGDLMLVPVSGASRRFDAMGYGDFEAKYVRSKADPSFPDKVWFERLETLVAGLDMQVTGIFDARREQIQRLQKAVDVLAALLESRLVASHEPAKVK